MLSISRQLVNSRLYKPITFIKHSKAVTWNIWNLHLKTHSSVPNHHTKLQVQYLPETGKERNSFLGIKIGSALHVKFLSVSVVRDISKKNYEFPEVKEDEVEERFVRGSGPGGQSVNQTANCVVLKHLPTGIVVKCHETRSLEKNRKRARERLQDRLDVHINGENSFLMMQQREGSERKAAKKNRSRKRLEMKKAFKEEMGKD